jgi:hypothetical protein
MIRDIEEMAVLCYELLKSDISRTSLIDTIMTLTGAIGTYYSTRLFEKNVLPERVIECLREANKSLPDCLPISIAFAISLLARFFWTPSNDDYEEGTAVLDIILVLPSLAEYKLNTIL